MLGWVIKSRQESLRWRGVLSLQQQRGRNVQQLANARVILILNWLSLARSRQLFEVLIASDRKSSAFPSSGGKPRLGCPEGCAQEKLWELV